VDLETQAAAMQRDIAQLAGRITAALRDAGYEFVLVRVGKVVRGKDGHCAMPAATASAIQPSIFQCLRLEAGELRRIADEFEKECAACGVPEATHGYAYSADPKDFGL
jgi:hypothetical protein